jgi:Zn-dependent M28 family amino/carboxypeptidase
MKLPKIAFAGLALLAAACATTPAGKPGAPGGAPITADAIANRVKEISDDKYQGRAPASPAGLTASQWIADEMKRIGLQPAGENGTYFQTVALSRSNVDPAKSYLEIGQRGGRKTRLAYGTDAVFLTKKIAPEVTFKSSDLVFVGHGVVAPEENWNDYAGLDVKGKTVVILVNDPGFADNDPTLFKGKAMTYYGRWTYKFEEAGRQGAAAALIVHETVPAAYGWDVVKNSWTGDQYDLVRPDGAADRTKLEGWITLDVAKRLFKEAGLDFDTEKAAAQKRGFKGVPMGHLAASARIVSNAETLKSRNVAGVLKGAKHPDEYVLLTAHWDHLGVRDVPAGQDGIYNGAVDNGTGVASILTIAESLAKRKEPLDRSVLVLSVTAEESGLLGSDYFAQQPLVPLKNIVGGLNIDALQPIGPAHDIVVIGYGASQLEDVLARHAAAAGKHLTPDPSPEAGYFYRSDHVSLAKRGVPMIDPEVGQDLISGGVEAGKAAEDDYRAHRYHSPADEYSPSWNLTGVVEDVSIFRDWVADLASSQDWPNWYPGNEFRALRDAQRAGAK